MLGIQLSSIELQLRRKIVRQSRVYQESVKLLLKAFDLISSTIMSGPIPKIDNYRYSSLDHSCLLPLPYYLLLLVSSLGVFLLAWILEMFNPGVTVRVVRVSNLFTEFLISMSMMSSASSLLLISVVNSSSMMFSATLPSMIYSATFSSMNSFATSSSMIFSATSLLLISSSDSLSKISSAILCSILLYIVACVCVL